MNVTVTGGAPSQADLASRRGFVSRIARTAEGLSDVYATEYFVSSLLGQMWEQRGRMPSLPGFDLDLLMCAAPAQELADHGGRGAKLALHTIGRLVPGELGALGAQLAAELPGQLPRWTRDIGRSRVVTVTGTSAPGDGAALLLEVRGVGMIDHAIAVWIDERRRGIAKHLGLLYAAAQRPPDAVDDGFCDQPRDVQDACRQVLDAIAVTDGWPQAPVGDGFATLRMLALARAASTLSVSTASSPAMN